jgi:hypothetical protein
VYAIYIKLAASDVDKVRSQGESSSMTVDRSVAMRSSAVLKVFIPILAAMAFAASMVTSSVASTKKSATTPPGLTAYGRLVWNFDGLLRQTLGTSAACEDASKGYPSQNWTRSACKKAAADQIDWQPVFTHPVGTTFATSASPPPNIGNVAPIRIAGLFVRCTTRTWLVEFSGGQWGCA